jgi:hypothetical protein
MWKMEKISNFEYTDILLFSAILFSLIFHIVWWDFPLVRDEGEFAVIARQILQGIPLYKEAYNYKLPGVSLILASQMLFLGKTLWTVRWTGMLINVLSIWMIFRLSSKWFGSRAGIFSAFFYSILSNHYAMIAYSTMSEQFVVLFILLALTYLHESSRQKIFISGIFFGFAFLMKQSAIFMLLIPYFYFAYSVFPFSRKQFLQFAQKSILVSIGIFLPYLGIVGWVLLQGSFTQFWNWTYVYPSEYSMVMDLRYAWNYLFSALGYISYPYRFIWMMALFGFLFLIGGKEKSKLKYLFVIYSVLAGLSVSAGLYFRFHYFYFILPVLSISASYFVWFWIDDYRLLRLVTHKNKNMRKILKTLTLIFFLFLGIYGIMKEIPLMAGNNLRRAVRRVEARNPYYEMPVIAQKIATSLRKEDQLVVFGSDAELYFYLPNKNATSYLFTYEMVKPHKGNISMQLEFIEQVEKNKPKIFIDVDVYTSWLRWDHIPDTLFRWKEKYLENYDRLALVEYDQDTSIFLWEIPDDYQAKLENVIQVYQRKK